jgi:RNA recognition motif-containing protein
VSASLLRVLHRADGPTPHAANPSAMAEDGGGDSDRDQHQQQQPAAPEGRSGESVKLFVGQVPKQMTEPDLAAMFRGVALVDEVTVIRDRGTRVSRGPDPYASLPPHLLRAAMQCGRLGFARIWARVSSARLARLEGGVEFVGSQLRLEGAVPPRSSSSFLPRWCTGWPGDLVLRRPFGCSTGDSCVRGDFDACVR